MHARSTAPILLLALVSSLPAFALQRAFVSSTGNDANAGAGCTLAAPCRSFQAAHTAVDASGEIVALDTAGYGAVTISKSVTITSNPGVIAGIAVSSGDAVTIATGGVNVILRGLAINDVGTGGSGVNMTAGSSLSIENCVVSKFNFGLFIDVDAKVKVVNSLLRGNNTGLIVHGGATVDVMNSQFLGNTGGFGISTGASAGSLTTVSISDSVVSDNFVGIGVIANGAGAVARLSCIRCTASSNFQNGIQASADAGGGTAVVVVSNSKTTFNGGAGLANMGGGGTVIFGSSGNNVSALNAGGETSGAITPVPAS